MRNVFFIAYHFPPIQSAGVERTIKFIHYLPEFGYDAQVLTTSAFGRSDNALHAWEPLQVYRRIFNPAARHGTALSANRTSDGSGLRSWISRVLCIPDMQISWLPAALFQALLALNRQRSDLIYSTSPPASAHLLALALKSCTGLPWVADFRDSWVYDPLDPILAAMPRRRQIEQRLEATVVKRANAVVATTDISAEQLRNKISTNRVEVITNGFDGELAAPYQSPRASQTLHLVYTGSFSHSHPQRTPLPLFNALQLLRDADSRWSSRLHLSLAGSLSPGERDAAGPLVEAGMIELIGVIEPNAVLALQRTADVLILIDHTRPWPASNVPGKFYEYLAARRPMLALAGAGMVSHLISELNAGLCVDGNDVAAVSAGLVQFYEQLAAGTLCCGVQETVLKRFHRRFLTRQLAACFDSVLSS